MPKGKKGWQPGQSGNPKGRPKDPERERIRNLAREHTEAAIRTLVECMNDTGAKWVSRLKAAEILLDRGYGKAAPLPPEVEPEETKTVTTQIGLAPDSTSST